MCVSELMDWHMSFLPPVMAHSKYSINIFKLLKDRNERTDEKINEQTSGL